MINQLKFMRKSLRASSALQALSLLGAGISLASVATPASAQDYSQVNATGKVQGTDGKAIAGATVTVTSNAQGFTRTVTTGNDGAFRVAALPQGTYTFTITADGFDTLSDNNVGLSQAGAANQFTLQPSGTAQGGDIVVTAGRVQTVDFSQNTTGAVINIGELATRVPVARDVTSVVLLSPGTTSGDTAFGNLPSINGSSVSENVYYINGLNITQFRNGLGAVPVPFDFFQTVDVKNGGIPAEFGRTTGGVINEITKSGSNEFHGGITFNWEPDDLRSRSPNTYATDNDSQYSERKEMIAQLSGPIIKDHLFFYGLYQTRDVQSGGGYTGTASALDPRLSNATGLPLATQPSAATLSQSCFINPLGCANFGNLANSNLRIAGTQYIKDRNTSPFYGGKVDAVIVDGQRLEFTYFNTSSVTTRNTFGTSAVGTLANGGRYNPNTNNPGAYASTTVFRSGGENYVGRYTGTFTDWLTVSAAYGRNKNRDTTESNQPGLPYVLDQRNGANTSIGNTTSNQSLNYDDRKFYRGDVDLIFRLLGSHHIRAGYDREDLNENSISEANGIGQVTLATASNSGGTGIDATTGLAAGTNYALVRTFTTGGTFKTRDEAYYIQDQWQLLDNRLSINAGIRNDRFVNRNADGVAFYRSGDQWGPRLGFNFDPAGDGKTRIYGSFSRYYLPVAVNTNVRLAGSELDVDSYYLLSGLNADNSPILGAPVNTVAGGEACVSDTGPAGTTSCVVRNDGTVPPTSSTVASNLKSQSTDEYILGFEHRLSSRIKFGTYFTQSKLNNSLEDGALDQALRPLCVAAGTSAARCNSVFNGVHQFALINPGEDVSVVVDGAGTAIDGQTVTLSAAALGYPHASRTYRAMTFTFEREFDGVWSLAANYTYSKLYGNIEGGIRSDNGQSDSGLTTAFDLPALVNGAYGYLPNDRRHNIKIYGSYSPFNWLSLGANLSVTSQRRFGCIGRVPANADGNIAGQFYGAAGFYCNLDAQGNVISNPITSAGGAYPVTTYAPTNPLTGASSLQLTPRGSQFKSDWLYLLNVDATIKVPTDAFDGFIRVTVFNVLNRKAQLDFNEVGTATAGTPNATYGYATSYQAPRSARIQFGVNF